MFCIDRNRIINILEDLDGDPSRITMLKAVRRWIGIFLS